MRTGISITITPADHRRLQAITRDRNAAQKHAWRAAIVLLSADGIGTNEIMRQTGKSKTCVWRWQKRFMDDGVDGFLHDKTRPSRIPRLAPAVAERVVALTLTDPPAETTPRTADLMARSSGISASAVRRIWRTHGLQAAINRFVAETNADPKPFTWTADPDRIIAAVRRRHPALDSVH